MNAKERLEEIKDYKIFKRIILNEEVNEDDKWLIQQADLLFDIIDIWGDYDLNGTEQEKSEFFHEFRRLIIKHHLDKKRIEGDLR